MIEALVAMGIVVTVTAGVAHLLLWERRATWSSGARSTAVVLASQKMATLQSLLWEMDPSGTALSDEVTDVAVEPPRPTGTGLRPSPGGTLTSNTAGFVDYLDGDGRWRGTGTQTPDGAAFVRRWSIVPFTADASNTLVLTVVVVPIVDAAGSAGPLERGAVLTTIRTRVVR